MDKWLKPYLSKYKGQVSLTIIFGFLGILSGSMLLFVSGYLISKSSLQPVNVMAVYVPIVSVRAFSIGQAAFPYLEKLTSHNIVLRILSDLRIRVYQILENQLFKLKKKQKTGDILSVISDDVEHLQDFFIKTAFPSILGLAVYTIFVLVLGWFDLVFMLIMILVLGVILFLMPYLSYKRNQVNFKDLKEKRRLMYSQLTDAVFGQVDWLASGRKSEVKAAFNAENKALVQVERRIQKWQYFREFTLRMVVSIAVILMLFWSQIQAEQGSITFTLIAAFVLMIFNITDALLPISEAIEELPTYRDSLNRLDELDEGSVEEEDSLKWKSSEPFDIHLENVSFTYPGNENKALDQLSLTIPAGEKLAILGKSGTGKSTLLKLIAGVLQPDQGRVLLDDKEMSIDYLSDAVSVLNQKAHLFNTSLYNNIKIGRPSATKEEVDEVIEKAQLTKLVAELPEGVHTQMDEFGKRFSGGEQQRIAFARVLLQDTPVILMDEPTIGLDPVTERDLLSTLIKASEGKTVIWITHHLAGANMMDRVLFLDKGKIKMYGKHEELLEHEPYYNRLYSMDDGIFLN